MMWTKGEDRDSTRPAGVSAVAPARQLSTQTAALVLGSGITVLGVVRALGRAGIPRHVISSSPGPVMYSRWYSAPPSGSELHSVDSLAEYLERLPLDQAVLIPASDDAVGAVARLPDHLRRRFPASVAPRNVVDTLVDKARLLEILSEKGVPHPRTVVLGQESLDLGDLDPERAFLKPRDSQAFARRFGVKAIRPRDAEDLRAQARWHVERGIGLIAQEYVPGPPTNHYFVDGFMDRTGTVRARLCRRRLRMFPADFGNSSAVVTVPPEEIASAVRHLEDLLADLRYRGPYSAEFKLDERDGELRLLEINARPWWYVEFAARCGVDVVRMAYRDALGLPVETPPAYQPGRRMVYPIHDAGAWRKLRTTGGKRGIVGQLHSLVVSDWATFAVDDPVPGWINAYAILGRVMMRRLRRLSPSS